MRGIILRKSSLVLGVVVVAVFAVSTSGCAPVPVRYVSAPGARGRVVDADSRVAIRGALVTVSRPNASPAQTRSAGDGSFRVLRQHRWYVYDALHPKKCLYVCADATLTIEQDDYESFATNIHWIDVLEAGEIGLSRSDR